MNRPLSFAVAVLLAVPSAFAQDPVAVSPQLYTVRLENDCVRVLEYNLKAGEREPLHSHPRGIVYVFGDSTIRSTLPDGSSAERPAKAGEVFWREPSQHMVANVGTTTAHALAVDLKECGGGSMTDALLHDLGTRYAAAWSSQKPASLAAFYAENGALKVNAGAPSVGRAAITAAAGGFMSAFPDMVVKLDRIVREGDRVVFHWIWTGTNTGPGGTGKAVRITGYEEWTLDKDGLIAESKGHYDEAEYQRQVAR